MNTTHRPAVVTAIVFVLSGSAALIFETAWFRIAGLALGSSVWSAAAILMAFMAGLGIGNLLTAAYGHRIRRPFIWYAVAEILIGIFGLLTVIVLPAMTPLIARWLAALISDQTVLNAARFGIAFSFFLIPAIAMGATLPILQKGLFEYNKSFSKSLAHLYGWNTIGAVAGALISEFVLIEYSGLTGAAGVACLFNFLAALILLQQFRGAKAGSTDTKPQAIFATIRGLQFNLLPPFLTGLVLLALEVVWFRFLLLTQNSGSAVFAIMLAVVLAGIGIGGIVASRLKLSDIDLDRLIFRLCLLSTVIVLAGYSLFSLMYAKYFAQIYGHTNILILEGAVLMLPSCILSGILFPLFGETLHRKVGGTTSPAGALTFANTIGSAIGTGLATFLLLPVLGVEYSIFVLSLVYILVALLVTLNSRTMRRVKIGYLAPALTLLLVVVLFPYGTMNRNYEIFSDNAFANEQLVAVKEGVNETLQYYRKDKFGQPLEFRLVTNGHSMSGTTFASQRYMRMYVHMPYLLRDEIKSVLQISYGVGVTAEAAVALPAMERYDVVDISRDVLSMSDIIHAASGVYPQQDPRTRVHVEDGRFFLQTTKNRYDLITAEPPPPKNAGVVSLYSQEYFELMHTRLNEGGIASYWLPVNILSDGDTLAIIKAFCNAFSDCSLWTSAGLEFMLIGSKGGIEPSALATMEERWTPPMSGEMRSVGLEKPWQIGAMFIGDNQFLQELTENSLPVVDDFPMRISNDFSELNKPTELKTYLVDSHRRQRSFAESSYIRSLFPQALIEESLRNFGIEAVLINLYMPSTWKIPGPPLEMLAHVLTETDLVVLPALMLGSSPREQKLVGEIDRLTSIEHFESAIAGAFADRDYARASTLLEYFLNNIQGGNEVELQRLASLYYLSRGLAGTLSADELLADKNNPNFQVTENFVDWMKRDFL